jgi:hypothetical protein
MDLEASIKLKSILAMINTDERRFEENMGF